MKYLSDYTNDKQTKLFDEMGSFFAFSDKQFNEAKKEGVKYVSVGAGLICDKRHVEKLLEGLKKINDEGIKQDIKENGKAGIIKRELENHEYCYTGDITDTKEALSDYNFKDEEILKVAKQLN